MKLIYTFKIIKNASFYEHFNSEKGKCRCPSDRLSSDKRNSACNIECPSLKDNEWQLTLPGQFNGNTR
jgi:hypothetical protein